MKRLLLCLLALAFAAPASAQVGPPNQILCNKQGFATVSTNTTTSLVTGVAGQTVFICGWHVTSTQPSGNVNAFQFVNGTQGGPCGTPVNMTPSFTVANTAPSADHIDFAQMSTPVGAQLCVVSSGTTTTDLRIMVWYSQF